MVSQGPALARSAQELLGDFVRTGSQEPFEEIVRRYAGMVFNVCYQILRDTHDAEDATQAVFLTLAVKSKTENGIKYLAPWLQKVAQRLALDVKRSKTRRKAREERHSVMQQMNAGDGDTTQIVDLDEVKVVLRDELDKLPAKYRLPLILHYFGGMKPEEMARELGCKPSTLGVRLHRGRKLLAENLQGRGVSISGSLLGTALALTVRSSVHEHLIQHTTVAAMHAASGNLASAGVSAQVLTFNKLAEQGLFATKIKAAVTAAIIFASACAGAAEFVAKIRPFGMEMNLPGQIRSLFDPILRTFRRPLRVPVVNAPKPADVMHDVAAPNENVVVSNELTLSAQPAPAPLISHLTSTDNGAGAVVAKTQVTSETILPTFTLKQPTIHWPAPTPSKTTVALAPVDGSHANAQATPAQAPPILASDQSFTIGGGFGSNESVTYAFPAPTTVRRFVVGGNGNGVFHQTGGQLHADLLSIGQGKGSNGTYIATGDSAIDAGTVEVGGEGLGKFVLNGASATFSATDLLLGREKTASGTFDLVNGKANENFVAVGVKGAGFITQYGGTNHISDDTTQFTNASQDSATTTYRIVPVGPVAPYSDGLLLALSNGSQGRYDLHGGYVFASKEVVAERDKATFRHLGGTNTTPTIKLGAYPGSDGTYKLADGDVRIERTHAPHTGITVGGAGSGALAIGGTHTSGDIYEIGHGKPTSLIVRADFHGDGRIVGWGTVGLQGSLEQNGQVVVDGFGKERDLDLSSFAAVTNNIDNKPGQDNGYFARHGGRLLLPPVDITGAVSTVTWGENASDKRLDLINSVRLTFNGVENPGEHSLALLSPDRSEIPAAPDGVQFTSVWHGDFDSLGADSMALTLRYDDTASPGIAGGNVQFWASEGGAWKDLTSSANIDINDRLISGTFPPSDWFAVSTISNTALLPGIGDPIATIPTTTLPPNLGVQVPEPASLGLIVLGTAAFLRRRRRLGQLR